MRRRPIARLQPPAHIEAFDPDEWESPGAYEDAVREWQRRNPKLMTPLGVFQRCVAARRRSNR